MTRVDIIAAERLPRYRHAATAQDAKDTAHYLRPRAISRRHAMTLG